MSQAPGAVGDARETVLGQRIAAAILSSRAVTDRVARTRREHPHPS